MSRKSKAITLTMLAGTAIVLGGCWDDDEPKLVKNAEECSERFEDAEGCQTAARQAQEEHEKSAPRFTSRKDCEAEFGSDRCQPIARDGVDWFIPAMTGFLIGRMLDGSNSYRVQPACANRDDLYTNGCGPVRGGAHPAYSPAHSYYAGRYAGGSFTPEPSYTSSWTGGKVAASRAAASPAAIARGGFGGSAVGHAAVGE